MSLSRNPAPPASSAGRAVAALRRLRVFLRQYASAPRLATTRPAGSRLAGDSRSGSVIARALLTCGASLILALVTPAQSSFERGVEAYRSGDYAGARSAWRATLAEELDELDRARVLFDLGNAYWRLGESLPAIVCYSAAVRLDPRHADAWQNLELARAKANLPPADAGDLGATIERLLTRLRPAERRALLFAALALWSLVLVLEVRFGGAALRATLVTSSLLLSRGHPLGLWPRGSRTPRANVGERERRRALARRAAGRTRPGG